MRKFWSVPALFALLLVLSAKASAGPALLLDAETSQVFYAEEADRPWHPASTTKLMTAYLTFQAIRNGKLSLTDAVLQSERSIGEPPSKIGLPVGLGMTVDLALQALIIKSANDVAVMLAEKIGGNMEAFVGQMNATAKKLGMTSTHFVNPNGLHQDGQVTTARDLARLALALLRDFPEHKERYKTYYMQIGKRRLHSYNSLLKHYEGADGMKTGFVCASGYNVVASATRNGRKLIAVVLGAKTGNERAVRAASLFDYGFEYYDWKMLLTANAGASRLNEMPLGEETAAAPGDMRGVVCSPRRVVSRSARKKGAKARRSKARQSVKPRTRH